MRRCPDEPVQRGSSRNVIHEIEVNVALVPRGAGILQALRDQVVALNSWTVCVDFAINRSIWIPRECRIASRIRWRGPDWCADWKLRQAVKRLIGVIVIQPVLA